MSDQTPITLLEYLHPIDNIFERMVDYDPGAGPQCSGVYFLADGPALVYVGSSSDVATRLHRHHVHGRKQFTRYACIPVPLEHLLAVEGFYVLFMGWPYYNVRLLSAHYALEHLVPSAKAGSLWPA